MVKCKNCPYNAKYSALVGAGMTAACPNEYMTKEEIAYVLTLLESFGRVEIIPERLMDTVVSVSGSSPAYVFMFIEAMADAAVSGGMPRAQAYQFAARSSWKCENGFWKPESIQVS